MSNRIDPTALLELTGDERAYFYQKAQELTPFLTSAMALSMQVDRPEVMGGTTSVTLSLSGESGEIEASGQGTDFFNAVLDANDRLLNILDSLHDQVMSQEERNMELVQSKVRVH